MKSPAKPLKFAGKGYLLSTTLLLPSIVSGATIYQTVNSTSDSAIHLNGSIWGDPASAPTSGNDYISENNGSNGITSLRTGSAATGTTFTGGSLTLRGVGINTITLGVNRSINANWIFESGSIVNTLSSKGLNGTLQVNSSHSTVFKANSSTLSIGAATSGSGTIEIQGTTGSVSFTSSSTTFAGTFNITSGRLSSTVSGALGNGNFSVTGGVLDIGYAFGGPTTTSSLSLSGTGDFDLSNGFNHTFNTVSIAGTFLDAGIYSFASLNSAQQEFFVNGSDTFTVLSSIPEPSTYALMSGAGTLLLTLARRRKVRSA